MEGGLINPLALIRAGAAKGVTSPEGTMGGRSVLPEDLPGGRRCHGAPAMNTSNKVPILDRRSKDR